MQALDPEQLARHQLMVSLRSQGYLHVEGSSSQGALHLAVVAVKMMQAATQMLDSHFRNVATLFMDIQEVLKQSLYPKRALTALSRISLLLPKVSIGF